jgi:hypothetical protein
MLFVKEFGITINAYTDESRLSRASEDRDGDSAWLSGSAIRYRSIAIVMLYEYIVPEAYYIGYILVINLVRVLRSDL